MSDGGALKLSFNRLDEAVIDLDHATEIYRSKPEFWFQLGLAHARRGTTRIAAESFSRCARYALPSFPSLAAESILLAAGELRSMGAYDDARDLIYNFLQPLDRC